MILLLLPTWHSPCRTGSPSPPCRWPPCCSPRSCPRGRTRTRTRGDTRPPPPAAARLSAGTREVFFTLLCKLDIIYWHRCSHFRYLETLQMASSCWPLQNSLSLFQFMVDIICFIYLFLEMILHISLFEHNLNFTTKILLG